MFGLRDVWLYLANEQAKQLFLEFSGLAVNITSSLSDETDGTKCWQRAWWYE